MKVEPMRYLFLALMFATAANADTVRWADRIELLTKTAHQLAEDISNAPEQPFKNPLRQQCYVRRHATSTKTAIEELATWECPGGSYVIRTRYDLGYFGEPLRISSDGKSCTATCIGEDETFCIRMRLISGDVDLPQNDYATKHSFYTHEQCEIWRTTLAALTAAWYADN